MSEGTEGRGIDRKKKGIGASKIGAEKEGLEGIQIVEVLFPSRN